MIKNGIKIFNLPDVAFRTVIQFIKPKHILLLSMCSKKAKKKLQSVSSHHSAHICVVDINSEYLWFQVLYTQSMHSFSWTFTPEPTEDVTLTDLNLCGVETKVNLATRSQIVCENVPEVFMAVLNHVLSVFCVPLDVCIRPGTPRMMDLLSMRCFAFCKKLHIHKGFNGSNFEEREVATIFEKIQGFDELTVGIETTYRLDKIFKANQIRISRASWMDKNDLKLLESCAHVHLGKHNFTCEDIEDFVFNWLFRDEISPQKRFIIAWPNDRFPEFKNLKKSTWNPTKRSMTCLKNNKEPFIYNFEKAMDFERQDGLLASVIFSQSSLIFHVWHEPFPMKEEEERLRKEIENMYSQLPQVNENFGLSHEMGRVFLNRNLSISDFETYKLEVIFLRQNATENLNQWTSFINQLDYTRRRLFVLTNNVN